jgi:putative zinc finger protein
MTMHELWTDQLSDYLDDELAPTERAAIEAHLRDCQACSDVLNDLKRVVAQAQTLEARPPRAELWPGVAARIDRTAQPRRFSFTLGQLAAAAALLMAISGGAAWQVADRSAKASRSTESGPLADAARSAPFGRPSPPLEREGSAERSAVAPVSFADAQYDAAVADLEKAVRAGRGRLDKATIDIVEHNLQIIDQAITQARDALAADPANSYLSSHLVEARRRKLDLLRRAAALAESN